MIEKLIRFSFTIPRAARKVGRRFIVSHKKGTRNGASFRAGSFPMTHAAIPALTIVANFVVSTLGQKGRPRILVTSHHVSDYPNQFAMLDTSGKVLGEYWHSGFLDYIELLDRKDGGGKDILLGGVDNGRHAATLVQLDSRNLSGATAEQEGNRDQLQGFSPAKEKVILLFPRTCINKKFDEYNKVTLLAVRQGNVHVNVGEWASDAESKVIYDLSTDLSVKNVDFTDRFREAHQELHSKKELGHALSPADLERMKEVTILRPAAQKGKSVRADPIK